jgi:hypothetical protein
VGDFFGADKMNDSCGKMTHMGTMDGRFSILKYNRCESWNVVLKLPTRNKDIVV